MTEFIGFLFTVSMYFLLSKYGFIIFYISIGILERGFVVSGNFED